jgi:hypothetical protein
VLGMKVPVARPLPPESSGDATVTAHPETETRP